MTVAEFRQECIRVMGEHRRDDAMSWSVSYLLAALRHHGMTGAALWHKAVDAGL